LLIVAKGITYSPRNIKQLSREPAVPTLISINVDRLACGLA
jgi:hypothetical protein